MPAKATKPKALQVREDAAKILLEARRLAERGWIKEGRRNTTRMLMDTLEEAFVMCGGRRNFFAYARATPPDLGRAMAYMCQCTFRDNDPGTNRGRYKQLFKQEGTAYMTYMGGVFNTFRRARVIALEDIQAVRADLRQKRGRSS